MNPPFKKPYRVETWFERDRSSIVVYDADDREIAEWWDDDVQDMFESGYFTPGKGERALADSVIAYVGELGLDKQRRNPDDLKNPKIPYDAEQLALSQRLDRAAASRREGMKQFYEISAPDVGHATIRFQGQVWQVSNFMGRILKQDIGKRIFRRGDILQVENDEQRDRRLMKLMRKLSPDLSVEGNPPVEIISSDPSKSDPGKLVLHYRITSPMNSAKDVEKVLATLYPGWKAVAHASLKEGTHPGVKHAYSVTLVRTRENPPRLMDQAEIAKQIYYRAAQSLGLDLGGFSLKDLLADNTDWSLRNIDDVIAVMGTEVTKHFLKKNPPFALSVPEKVLLSAFKAHARLSMKDIPGHYAEGLANLVNAGLVRPVPGVKATWELTPKGRTDRGNPPLPGSVYAELSTARTICRELAEELVSTRSEISVRLDHVSDLLQQAMSGLRESHKGHVDWSNPPATEIYRDIVEIRAVKPDGKRYVHKFGRGSNIFGLADGSILIRSRKGKRLWKNFKVEG